MRPTREQAEQAIKTLLEYIGENPNREGLIDTPKRVIKSYDEFFKGYSEEPEEILAKTFEDVEGYDEIVLLKNMRLESYCEHHMVPIVGKAHVAYLPNGKVVGISKIARVVDVYSKRLQTQERLTMQIALAIEKALIPKGVAVIIDSMHQCMTTRGVRKSETSTVTSCMRGIFRRDEKSRSELMLLISGLN
ncbi:GTP cyclohydrolase I FolE [Fastidiosibacter lacustris]|uniref:GTP cyclohydrolase I FolE n=1 Tax=Fastidiosibacter lacustris TaxID=2056695 RepID=UPI000E344297|nr:GTP cyclohydrolase I FolE [Fastidiosibacter lacustris]